MSHIPNQIDYTKGMRKESIADFLLNNSQSLSVALANSLNPTFQTKDFSEYMETIGRILHFDRALLGKQAESVAAAEKHLKQYNAVILGAATGTGKTTMGVALASAHQTVYAEVPPHLVQKTKNELGTVLGEKYGFDVKTVHRFADVLPLTRKGTAPTNPTFYIVSKETASRSYLAEPVWNIKKRRAEKEIKVQGGKQTVRWTEWQYCCPDCGAPAARVTKEEMQKLASRKRPRQDEIEAAMALSPEMSELEIIENLKMERAIASAGPSASVKTCKVCKTKVTQPKNDIAGYGAFIKKVEAIPAEDLKQYPPAPKKHHMGIAEFLKRYGVKGRIDLGISDEFHESKGEDALRAEATGTLIGLSTKFVGMTGTLLGGYASHLYYLLFRMFPTFMVREMGYKWENKWDFIEEFGGTERQFEVGEYDAVEQEYMPGARSFGKKERPELSPRLLEILMPFTVFLRLDEIKFFEDSDFTLPPLMEKKHVVAYEPELHAEYLRYVTELGEIARGGDKPDDVAEGASRKQAKELYKQTRTSSRKVFAQLNTDSLLIPDDPFTERSCTGLVFDAETMSVKELTATYTPPVTRAALPVTSKEQKLLDIITEAKARNHQVLVYVDFVNSGINENLKTLIEERLGLKAHVLRSEDAPAAKREAYIKKLDCDVLITNPALVQTGLDLLEYPEIVFFEQMYSSYNVFIMRQAMMRSWRIGQKNIVGIHMIAYAGTQQHNCAVLMGGKIAVSTGVEGILSNGDDMASMAEDENVQIAMARKILKGELGTNASSIEESVTDLNAREWNPFEQYYIAQMEAFEADPEAFSQYAPAHLSKEKPKPKVQPSVELPPITAITVAAEAAPSTKAKPSKKKTTAMKTAAQAEPTKVPEIVTVLVKERRGKRRVEVQKTIASDEIKAVASSEGPVQLTLF